MNLIKHHEMENNFITKQEESILFLTVMMEKIITYRRPSAA